MARRAYNQLQNFTNSLHGLHLLSVSNTDYGPRENTLWYEQDSQAASEAENLPSLQSFVRWVRTSLRLTRSGAG